MCEFCTKHGEGKKWYLQMKNYAEELLDAELSAVQKDITGATTRHEWNNRNWEAYVLPAFGNVAKRDKAKPESPSSVEPAGAQPSEDEFVARRKIEHFGQVLPIEDVEQVIDLANSITRMPCGCRYITTGKTDKRYCFGLGIDRLGILGKFPDAAASLEVLEKDEAKELFQKFDEEGLFHSVWAGVTPYVAGLCNCDRDCGAYRRCIEKRGAPSFFRAEYVGQVDWDLCTGCKECMSQCQFGAQFYSSGLGKVYIDPTRCYGCGVCRAACTTDAITLIPRQQIPEVANVWLKY